MKIKLLKEESYTPKWNDNEKNEKPIVFDLKYLTTGEMDDCVSLDGKYDTKQVFRYAVKAIHNLEVNDKAVTTADGVIETPGLSQLFYEVIGFVLRMNPVTDSKN